MPFILANNILCQGRPYQGTQTKANNCKTACQGTFSSEIVMDSEAVGLFRSLMQIRSQHLSTIYKHNLS